MFGVRQSKDRKKALRERKDHIAKIQKYRNLESSFLSPILHFNLLEENAVYREYQKHTAKRALSKLLTLLTWVVTDNYLSNQQITLWKDLKRFYGSVIQNVDSQKSKTFLNNKKRWRSSKEWSVWDEEECSGDYGK